MGAEIPLERGHQRGIPPVKIVILPLLAHLAWKRLEIDTDLLLIITSTADELSSGTNIDDLERPWTCKIGVYSECRMVKTMLPWFTDFYYECSSLDPGSLKLLYCFILPYCYLCHDVVLFWTVFGCCFISFMSSFAGGSESSLICCRSYE